MNQRKRTSVPNWRTICVGLYSEPPQGAVQGSMNESTIWKFTANIADAFSLEIPAGSMFLHVDIQAGTPCMWFRVSPSAPLRERKFAWRGTGHDCTGLREHLGSVLMHGGGLVFHLFAAQ